jgi:hypothetical protein
MENDPPATGEHYLVLDVRFHPPIPVGYHRLSGRYSIFPRKCRTAWTRGFGLVLNSEGVSVSLILKNNQNQLFHKDILACERSWFRLVQRQLARHHQIGSWKSIRERLVDQLNALVSQDKGKHYRRLAQSHDLSLLPLSRGDRGRYQVQYTEHFSESTSLPRA